jgi:hypothetical protein
MPERYVVRVSRSVARRTFIKTIAQPLCVTLLCHTPRVQSADITPSRFRATPAFLVAVLYVAAWAAGLILGAPEVDVEDSGSDIHQAHIRAPHALVQAALVHGVAGALIGVLGTLHARSLRRAGQNATAAVAVGSAVAAALLSFGQLAGEVVLSSVTASAGSAREWWVLVAVLDGVKMFALAALVLACARLSAGRVYRAVSVATAASLVVSGVGYLALQPALMTAAYVSLPLLLLWAVSSAAPRRNRAGYFWSKT